MGVLFDYFRAANSETAMRAMDRMAGPLIGTDAFDGVETKIDPRVQLGKLVAFIRHVPWDLDAFETVHMWPPPETKPATEEEYDELPEDSPWKEEQWLEELNLQLRDALATVDDARLPALAAEWAQIEEFHSWLNVDDALSLIEDLVGLGRRARNAGDKLYCWSSL